MTQNKPEQESKALSLDLDDVTFQRQFLARVFGAVNGLFKPYTLPNKVLTDIPRLLRKENFDDVTRATEKASLIFHQHRVIIPGVRELLLGKKTAGYDIYGNTGRANNWLWIAMTENAYFKNGIMPLITDTIYTPAGVTSQESKADALRTLSDTYEHVEHYEDDPRTAAFLATLFPDIMIHLIAYGTNRFLYPEKTSSKIILLLNETTHKPSPSDLIVL